MNDNLSKWEEIKRSLEMDIIKNVYTDKMPSINELARLYGCSTRTSAKVLDVMRKEEIIHNEKCIGYFVKPHAREMLLDAYKDVCVEKMEQLVREAQTLGIPQETLLKLSSVCITKIYSKG